MKRKLLLVALLITFSIVSSCSKDDDIIETINETFIVGKWKLSDITENGTNISLNDCELLKTLEFDSSYKVSIKTYDFNAMNVCEIDSNNLHDYSINHNIISIQSIGEAEIFTPSNETLILKSVEGSNIIIKTFSRQ